MIEVAATQPSSIRRSAHFRPTVAGDVHFYGCYGLVVRSEIELPELVAVPPAVPDVAIALRPVARGGLGPGESRFEFAPDEACLAWGAVGAFRVSGGRRIDVDPLPGVDPLLLPFPLLGPVIACLLSQRGAHVLHASAVSVGGRGVALMGDKGAGKSTTAGLMVSAGHLLLADDVLALDLAGPSRATIRPGFPQLKLADTAAEALNLTNAVALDMVDPAIGKRQHRVAGSFGSSEVPATRLYVLERGPEPGIEVLDPQRALQAVMRFSYMPRIDGSILSGAAAAGFFRQCVALARRASVSRLRVPDGLGRLGEVPRMIEEDLASAGEGSSP